ncbi:ShlB/FhaC/HecB family hemolysin secretion/activation protein [Cyanosarcina cf. burmensis CCALA 770]|nr:ShlB/FhaC/HecB family hemolysin secretion/activation protein [Cyanosarcina cf. burmensis CCALA 770]
MSVRYPFDLKIIVLSLTLLCLSNQSLRAQTKIPNRNIPTAPSTPFPQDIPKPPSNEPPIDIFPFFQSPETDSIGAGTIRVEKFIFKGNTVFSSRQLEAKLSPYLGRKLTFSELLQARSAITELYTQAGYINSGAFIPVADNQAVQTNRGIVTIQIVEGKMEAIDVRGSNRLRKYVLSRLKRATSPVLNVNRLVEALRLLQADPLLDGISAQLNAGSQIGLAALDVTVKEKQPFQVETILDNERSPAVGSFQRQIRLGHANLLGLGDELSVNYRNTDGSNAIETSYALPLNPQNGTLQFSYTNVSSKIIERPFTQLDIISDAQSYELSFRQPLLRQASAEATRELAVGIAVSQQEAKTSLLDTPFPISSGADERGRTRISAIRLFQEWSSLSNRNVFLASSQFSVGIDALNATINDSLPDGRFFAWRGQALWLRKFTEDLTLVLKGDLQLADRPLVSLEQFGLGGATIVRGYRQDTLISDNGVLLSAELRWAIWQNETDRLQIVPFFDIGSAWNRDQRDNLVNPDLGTLASVGLGLQYQIGDRLDFRLDWGIPLVDVETGSESNSWQDNGLYFSVRYRPF